jgi:small-conductance mechanosensitive channel
LTRLTQISLVLLFLGFCLSGRAQQTTKEQSPDRTTLETQLLMLENERLKILDSLRQSILSSLNNEASPATPSTSSPATGAHTGDSIRLFQKKQLIRSLRSRVSGAPVMLFYDTLFYVHTSLGSFSPKQRAENAEEKIRLLYEDDQFNPDSLVVKPQFGLQNICYQNEIITTISHTDALWLNADIDSLTANYHDRLKDRIVYFKDAYSFKNILLRIGYVLLTILILLLVLWSIRYGYRRTVLRLPSLSGMFVNGIKIRSYQLFSHRHIISGLKQILNTLRLILMLLVSYLALTFIFSIFPYTKTWTHTLLDLIWQPVRQIAVAIIRYIPNLVTIVIIILVARFVARIVRFFSLEVEKGNLHIKGFHKEWARPTYNILRFLVYAFSFIVLFPFLPGSGSEAFKGVSVFLGILFSIGSSSAVSNTIAGLVITYMRPFQTGDWIKVSEVTGCVMEKNALVTRIRTIHNEDITLPNSTILANHTVNYSTACSHSGLIVSARAGIGYDTDPVKVQELLITAAKKTTGVDTSQEPFVFQKSLDNFCVLYELNAYTQRADLMFHIQSELHHNIQHVLKQAGIELLVPQHVEIKPR